jgi:hypothetical protein
MENDHEVETVSIIELHPTGINYNPDEILAITSERKGHLGMDIEAMLKDLESDIEQAESDLKIAKERLVRIRKELKEEREG